MSWVWFLVSFIGFALIINLDIVKGLPRDRRNLVTGVGLLGLCVDLCFSMIGGAI